MRGDIAEIAIALQSVKGTPAATAQHRMRLAGGGLGLRRSVVDVEETTGGLLREAAFVARLEVGGGPQFHVRPKFAMALAYGALGALTSSIGPDPFVHTATLSASPGNLPWWTVWAMLSDGMRVRVHDCKIAGLRLESASGQTLRATATIVGGVIRFRTAAAYATDMGAVVVESADTFLHSDGAGQLLVEGVVVSAIERAVLDVQNGATPQFGDNITPDDITQALRQVSVETTQIIPDFALWSRLHFGNAAPANDAVPIRDVLELAGAPAGVSFKYQRPGAGAQRSLQYLVPRLVVAELGGLEPNTNGDPIRQAATYRAFQPASGSGVSIIGNNSQATYPAA